MNHVDSDFENRGNYLTLFTNDEDDYGHKSILQNYTRPKEVKLHRSMTLDLAY